MKKNDWTPWYYRGHKIPARACFTLTIQATAFILHCYRFNRKWFVLYEVVNKWDMGRRHMSIPDPENGYNRLMDAARVAVLNNGWYRISRLRTRRAWAYFEGQIEAFLEEEERQIVKRREQRKKNELKQ